MRSRLYKFYLILKVTYKLYYAVTLDLGSFILKCSTVINLKGIKTNECPNTKNVNEIKQLKILILFTKLNLLAHSKRSLSNSTY